MPQYDCCLCEEPFQFGPHHVYAGRRIPGWRGLMICRGCDAANRDGVVPGTYPHLVSRLGSLDIAIVFNENGWIVLP
jgi:hypothetical protein